jgi:hypothetical protein
MGPGNYLLLGGFCGAGVVLGTVLHRRFSRPAVAKQSSR